MENTTQTIELQLSAKIGKTAANINKLKESLKDVMSVSTTASVGINNLSRSVDNLTSSLSKLSQYKNTLKSATNTMSKSMGKTADITKSASDSTATFSEVTASVRDNVKDAKKSIDDYTNSLKDVERSETESVKDVLNGATSSEAGRDTTPSVELPELPQKTEVVKDNFGAIYGYIIQSVPGLSHIVSLVKRIVDLGTTIGPILAAVMLYIQSIKIGISILTKYLKFSFTILTKLAKFIGGQLIKPITEIKAKIKGLIKTYEQIVSRVKRMILTKIVRNLLSEIEKGFSEGISNLYKYSTLIKGEFAQSMDKYASSMLYFKNSIAAMISPLINMVVPVIETVVDRIVDAMNMVNQLFARLSGATYWTKALKYSTKYDDSVKQTGTDLKKLKDYTIGLDELNILNDNSGSSGSGTSDNLDYEKMFEKVSLDGEGTDMLSTIRKLFDNGEYGKIGEYFANYINKGIETIDWKSLGTQLGTIIQNSIDFALGWHRNLNVEAIGESIAEMLNGAIRKISFKDLGELLGLRASEMWEGIYGFAKKFNWTGLGNKVGVLINSYFNTGVLEKMATSVTTLADGILKFFINAFNTVDWGTLSEHISNSLKIFTDWVNSIDWSSMGKDIANGLGEIKWVKLFKSIGNFIKAIGNAAFDLIVSFVTNAPWDQVTAGILAGLKTSTTDNKFFASVLAFLFPGSVAINFGMELAAKMKLGLNTGMSTSNGNYSNLIATAGTNNGVFSLILSSAGKCAKSMASIPSDFKTNLKALPSVVTTVTESIIKGFKNAGTTIGKNLKNKLKDTFNDIIGYCETAINTMSKGFTKLSTGVKGAGSTIKSITSKIKLDRLATGGIVDAGQLFIANEKGPELVASYGNKTGVMNNAQIVESVSQGVYKAVTSAMSNTDNNGQNITINLDGQVIWKNQQKISMSKGYDLGMGVFGL